MGGVMSPRVVLGAPPTTQLATLVTIDGTHTVLGPALPRALGDTPVWDEVYECTIGGRPAWEFRHPQAGRCLVLQSVGDAAGGLHVYVAWVPADTRDGANPVFAALAPVLAATGVLRAFWPCVLVDGALLPQLDASPDADAVRAAWPADWRVRLPGDALGDPLATPPVPAAPPTGPLMLGAVLA